MVIDDGSTDNTHDVLRGYGDRIRYIYQQNGGCAAARNRGIREAQGEWIAFLDSDDTWMPEKLAIQMADIARFPQARAHVVNASIYRNRIGDTVNLFRYLDFEQHVPESPSLMPRPLLHQLQYGFGWPQCIMTRRSTLMEIGTLDLQMVMWQDTDLFYRVAALGPQVINSRPLVRILRRDEPAINLSRRNREKRVLSCALFVRIHDRLLSMDSLTREERLRVRLRLSTSFCTLGLELLKQGGPTKEARENLLRGFYLNPTLRCFVKVAMGFMPPPVASLLTATWRDTRRLRRATALRMRTARAAEGVS